MPGTLQCFACFVNMFSFNSLENLEYYEDLESDECPLDIFTAASIGEISFFLKFNAGDYLPLSANNDSGWTPIMYACSKGHDVLVYHLLHCGASKKCKSKSGATPLMLATSSGDFSTVENVFDVDDMELKDEKSWTALFYAVYFNRQRCLEFLLRKGANASVTDNENETPLIKSIKIGNEIIVEILLKAREKANILLDSNETLLSLATLSNNPKIQKLVTEHCKQSDVENKNLASLASEKTPNPKLLNLSNINKIQYSPSPIFNNVKKRSMFNFKLNKSLAYSPIKSAKSFGLSPFRDKSYSLNKTGPENDVETFLKTLGLERYWPIFREEEVDFETLLTLNDYNLKELGITKYGPRRKIYLAVQQIKKKY